MKILINMDGTICFSPQKIKKTAKIITDNNIPLPWFVVYLILLRTESQTKIDWEMIDALNLLNINGLKEIHLGSARDRKLEKYTLNFLEKNEINIFKKINCFGIFKSVKKKVDYAEEIGIMIIIDDDEKVRKEAMERGILSFPPKIFKSLVFSGVIR